MIIEKTDLNKLMELYKKAQNTPMIKLSSDPNIKDWATLAWDDVRELQMQLGKKYGYDWERNAIDRDGNVVPLNKVDGNK